MKLLIALILSTSLYADITSFTCDKSYTAELLAQYAEGEIDLDESNSIGFVNSSGYYEFYKGNKFVRLDQNLVKVNDDYDTYTVLIKKMKDNHLAPYTRYVFSFGSGEHDGTLTIYQEGGFVGTLKLTQMNCFVSQD